MKLIVFGASGGTGQFLVTQALKQGHEVTAFVRNPQKLKQKGSKLKVIQGDVLDTQTLEKAISGHDAVLCSIGLSKIFDKSNLRANGTKNIIEAMRKTKVKRLICQSTFGAGDSYNMLPFSYKYLVFPLLLRRVLADHEVQEKYVRESKLDWTIVRPGSLTDDVETGIYFHGFTAGTKVTAKISRADAANFMLKQLNDARYMLKSPSLSY
ncbi:MAG: SDR family oxidoreductase [Calditrichaeota bacterium]|nr:MAG: NAD-dependent epimerase/dehydratase family protein [Calditrichota bacterium]MBL1207822.1 SDR family oxidoreductase [Calditrichota bacterium]NOG47656.1 SDR family oxidoreductase [Calditrichota bacterium]